METSLKRPSRLPRCLSAAVLAVTLIASGPVAIGAQHGRYYGPYYGSWGWWGPYPYYPLINYAVSSLRVQVKPNDAQVFVDGYFAGEVDRFDNIFQRLEVSPGGHEITIYHDRFRTFRQQMHFAPGGDQKVEFQMEPLSPGEVAELPAASVRTPARCRRGARGRAGKHRGSARARSARARGHALAARRAR